MTAPATAFTPCESPATLGVVDRSGGERIYETQTAGGRRFRLTLREEDCSDGMSDAYYALSASARLDDRSFEGCAREGWR